MRYTLNLILAGLFPEKLIRAFEEESGDDYWQTYWVTMAYLKKGDVGKVEKAMSRLNLYKAYPESNEALLSSFISSFEFGNEVAKDYLAVIEAEPCSPELEPFYEALVLEIDPETAAHRGFLSDKTEFYTVNIIRIDNPHKKALVNLEVDLSYERKGELARLEEIWLTGARFLDGKCGRTKNVQEGFKWIRMAAELGHVDAQCYLGSCCDRGEGVAQDYAEAVKWYRKAAEQGNALAQNNLGCSYAKGKGVAQDDVEAVKWYRKAAEQGDANAQKNLGDCLEFGDGVAQDYVEAVKWYSKAADQGKVDAMFYAGRCCYKLGSYTEAVNWYRKAAVKGDAGAQTMLGYCYDEGKGVAQDYAEAVKWYRKAVSQGDVDAQNNLGLCYAIGKGVAQDYVEAIRWFRKAADQECDNALSNLGECYYWGHGVEKDEDMAKKFWKRAAEKGNQDAIDYLNGKKPEP